MNYKFKFDHKRLAKETSDAYSAGSYNSWERVCLELARRNFNVFEAEAILRSKITHWARDAHGKGGSKESASCLTKYLDTNKIVPHCAEVNSLVMGTFDGSVDGCPDLKLELNEEGIPCHRGTMPGNYHPDRTVLVPVGTPCCCDITSEAYWSQ